MKKLVFFLSALFILNFNAFTQIPNYLPSENLIAWYPFNGNANDESGNGLHGIVNGAKLTIDRFSNENSAFIFTTDQEIIIPNTEDKNLFPLTISLWYNVDSIQKGNNSNIFSKYHPAQWNGYLIHVVDGDSGLVTYPWYIRNNENRLLGLYGEGPFFQMDVKVNSWYHYVFVVDEKGGRIYVNGELIDSHEWTGEPGESSNTNNWKIGGLYNHWYHGKIDDIGIWNRALTGEEINNLFKGKENPPVCSLTGSLTDNLVAYYPFCGNANDESGNGLHGIVNGAKLTIDRYGNENSAFSFTTDQEIIVPNTEDKNLFPLTISLWYNVDSIQKGNNSNIFSKYHPAQWNGYLIHVVDGDSGLVTYPWYIRNNENRLLGLYGEGPFFQMNVKVNSWYHYVFIVDDRGGRIYVNGELIDSHKWTGEPGESSNTNNWKIGGLYNHWYHGKIDDIGIWNRALSEEEILMLSEGTHDFSLEISCPAELSVDCYSDVPAPDVSTVSINGNCGNVEVRHIGDKSNGNKCSEIIIRTYEASDDCGNIVICTQNIYVNDITPPTIICPPELAISCDYEIPAPASNLADFLLNGGDGSDNCGIDSFEWINDLPNIDQSSQFIVRTYQIIDECGNVATCSQNIFIRDTIPPSLVCPPDFFVTNASEVYDPFESLVDFVIYGGHYSDNCDVLEESFSLFHEILDTLVQPQELKRTYIISDFAGNESVCLHKFKIENVVSSFATNTLNNFDLLVYPNPNKGLFTVDLKRGFGLVTIEVFDPLGRIVKRKILSEAEEGNRQEFKLMNPSSGIYSVRIINGGFSSNIQFVVQ